MGGKVQRPGDRASENKKHHRRRKRPCRTAPVAPTGLAFEWDIVERSRWRRLNALLKWNETTTATSGATDSAERYFVQVERSADGGATVSGDPRRFVVAAKDDDANTTSSVELRAVRKHIWYRFRVKAQNSSGCRSDWSAWTSWTLANDHASPPSPTSVIATSSRNAIDLEWDTPLVYLPTEGTVTGSSGGNTLTGTGTSFQAQIGVGTTIRVGAAGNVRVVTSVPSDTSLVLGQTLTAAYTAQVLYEAAPDPDVAGFEVELSKRALFGTLVKQYKLRTATSAHWASTEYQTRFWWRVRSIDASGNKSRPWITVGPIRPSRTNLGRTVVAGATQPSDIDTSNTEGVPLAGGLTNQAYTVNPSDPASAVLDGESADGALECLVQTGSIVDRTYAGVTFRRQDASNYLYVAVVDTAGLNALVLGQYSAGVRTTIATSVTVPIRVESSYELKLVLAGTLVKAYLDGVLQITQTVSLFSTQTYYGLYARRGAILDSGESRWSYLRFTPSALASVPSGEYAAWDDPVAAWDDVTVDWGGSTGGTIAVTNTVPSIDEDFDRVASTVLSTATSGQDWILDAGSFGVEATSQPFAIYGSSVVMPVFYGQINDTINFSMPEVGVKKMGLGGAGDVPLSFTVDQPTRILANAVVTLGNRSTTMDYNARFWIVVTVNGVDRLGRGTSQHLTVDADPVTKWRSIATMRETLLLDATPLNPINVQMWWGFRNDSAAGRNASLRDAKMTVWVTYAPDIAASGLFSPRKRAQWTSSGSTRLSYRRTEGDDA